MNNRKMLSGFLLLVMLGQAQAVCADNSQIIKYTLKSKNIGDLFPSYEAKINSDFTKGLPAFYRLQPNLPKDLESSVEWFTKKSLKRDGIAFTSVEAKRKDDSAVEVMINGAGDGAEGYAAVMPQFIKNADLGLKGVGDCVTADEWCWNPKSTQTKEVRSGGKSYKEYQTPWAFYLPLGLPVVNQETVMFLNYPPSDSLCATDYTENFTIDRWTEVLHRVGITEPLLYETIVDSHPIAAPGSGMGQAISATTSYFSDYDQAMLNLLLNAPGRQETASTTPVMVSGADAHTIWGEIIGKTVNPGDMGVFQLPSQALPTPWIATNHPDVTTYQKCPGDHSPKVYPKSSGSNIVNCTFTGDPSPGKTLKTYYEAFNRSQGDKPSLMHKYQSRRGNGNQPKKASSTKYTDDALVQDEVLDLVSACTVKKYASGNIMGKTVKERWDNARKQCENIWCTDGKDCKKKEVCIQARLDYDFTSVGHCSCEQAAVAFCSDNMNNACPGTTAVTPCTKYNKMYCGS